jgi:general secretion pathway protein J
MQKNLGFTLIEVLIGMSLLSVMMLLLFGSLRISVRNWDAGEERIFEVSEVASVQNFFQRFLTSVRPFEDDFSGDEPEFSFQGESRKIRFVASLPASAGRQGLQIFSLKLKSVDDLESLTVDIVPFFPAADGEEWKNEEVTLAENISDFKLSYFGAIDEDDEATWHEQWLDQKQLPSLVKVEIEFENGALWPELVVAPRMSSAQPTSSRNKGFDLDEPDLL